MKLRCAVIEDSQSAVTTVADWSPVTAEVDVVTFTERLGTAREGAAALADFDIVVTLRERVPFPAEVFALLPRLRLLIASGMRNFVIDFAAAAQHGVTVCGTESSSAPPVELTWALLPGLARSIVPEAGALRADGPWQSTLGADLHGRTLGLLGLGKTGSRVAQVGRAFGTEVVAWSQNLTEERTREVGAALAASKEELLEAGDFVSVHLALSERIRGLIGAVELGRMRPTAYLVNTSRAAIVDQDALLAALHAGTIAGGRDRRVRRRTPPAGHPMRTAPRLPATVHLGYVSRANYTTYYGQAVEDIRAFLDGKPIRRIG